MIKMKEACLILFVVVCVATAISTVDFEWEAYKAKFNKQYSAEEDVERRQIFYKRKIMIEEHNQKYEEGKVTFEMGINKFADKQLEEIRLQRGSQHKSIPLSSSKTNLVFHAEEGATYPETVDWREKGYVTPVQDQGDCDAAWAFSAVGALEGQNFAKTGKLISFSVQNLIDCDDNCAQCYGGFSIGAFDYVIENGIETEESYPYMAKSGTCKYDKRKVGLNSSDWVRLPYGSEKDLLAATATIGPISVGIDADHESFVMYKSGVYYEPKCNIFTHNHYGLVVGYGNYEGLDYWLVKNYWGTDWGEEGYIMMARNKRDNCCIANYAIYPLVD